ncbi:MAG: FMN-binding protein [Gammaproteobacteria bacterium]|nr:FMN-binding protein [Gammaproteobacteria bacterium]MYF38098.1 FMN-binding protein [Gammaproteobacteria bacterium]
MKAIAKLTLLALISGCLLAILHSLTTDRINQNQRDAEAEVLADLVDTTDPELLREQGIELITLDVGGYGGTMKVVVAWQDDELLGVRAVSHGETPGFSDTLHPSAWIGQYGNVPVEDIDAVTGATITTTAVIRTIQDSFREREGRQP